MRQIKSFYLERSTPEHHKWYRVHVNGRTVTCSGGRIGADGVIYAVAHLDSQHSAMAWALDRVRAKLRRGYVEAVEGRTRSRVAELVPDPSQVELFRTKQNSA